MRFSFPAFLVVLYAAAVGFCLAAWRCGTGGGTCTTAGCSWPGDSLWLLGAAWCLAACFLLLRWSGRAVTAAVFAAAAALHAAAVAKGWAAGLACRPCLALLCLNAAGALACGVSTGNSASLARAFPRAAALAAGLFALVTAAAVLALPAPLPEKRSVPRGLVTTGLVPLPVQNPFPFPVDGWGGQVPGLAEAGTRGGVTAAAAGAQAAETGSPVIGAPAGRAAAAPCPLAVLFPDEGAPAVLDLWERPVLVFAVWCAHCGEALEAAARLGPGERPYLAVYAPGCVLPVSTNAENEKLAEHGLGGEPFWVVSELPAGAQALPALVRCGASGLEAVAGAGPVVDALESAGRR